MNISTERALPATADAHRHVDPEIEPWVSTTWAQFGARVTRWAGALTTLRLPRGSRVTILLPNGLDAVCMDQAALALALVPVPLHALDNPRSIAYILTVKCSLSEIGVSPFRDLTNRARFDHRVRHTLTTVGRVNPMRVGPFVGQSATPSSAAWKTRWRRCRRSRCAPDGRDSDSERAIRGAE